MDLIRHENFVSVAVKVIKFFRPKGKEYAMIKVRWYSLHPSGPQDMGFETWLTTAESFGRSTRERRKYPLNLWARDWSML